ncbi:hypothetical protein RND71_039824 [Anisodus tanguticus]|uniref:Uncharacterized protein n=1 Tax=Anisodus tanguticus TaxID=243964 RepID=A0AAE1QXH4_9SOLA|nr:hypothetical protein RND71_039824 [Anisodus tanguticus]
MAQMGHYGQPRKRGSKWPIRTAQQQAEKSLEEIKSKPSCFIFDTLIACPTETIDSSLVRVEDTQIKNLSERVLGFLRDKLAANNSQL